MARPRDSTCLDCGTAISHGAQRCNPCQARAALDVARASGRVNAHHTVARRGPIGELAAAVKVPGVTVRTFTDRRGALIVGRGGALIVELGAERMTNREATWLNRVDRALDRHPPELAIVRSPSDLAQLAERVRRENPRTR